MEDASTPVLRAIGLTRRYRDDIGQDAQAALADLHLELARGDAAMLIGLNGAGKSTLLRLAAGVELPSAGTISIFGQSARSSANRRRVGYLPDGAELFPFLNVEETLQFFASCAGFGRVQQKDEVARLIEVFGMQAYAKKRAAHHSTGMRRRLALASILIGKPEFLLLDEPASGLDPEASRLFLDVLLEERKKGVTIMMASHHLAHAEHLCNRVIVLAKGKLRFDGDLEELARLIGRRDLSLELPEGRDLEQVKDKLGDCGVDAESWRVSERGLEDFLIRESRR